MCINLTTFFPLLKTSFVLITVFFWSIQFSSAQTTGQLGMTELQTTAGKFVAEEDYIQALPYLEELAKRLDEATGDQQKSLEGIYFYLGLSYMQSFDNEGGSSVLRAIETFTSYETRFPDGERLHFVIMNRSDCYQSLGENDNAIKDLIKLLSPPLISNYSDENIRSGALDKLVKIYYRLEKWDEGQLWFKKLIVSSRDRDMLALSAAGLLRGYLNKKEYDAALEVLPYLVGNSTARYDVSLNVALIKGGDQLKKDKRINEATLLYYIALTKEEISIYFELRLKQLKHDLKILVDTERGFSRQKEIEVDIYNTDQQIVRLNELETYTPELLWRRASAMEAMKRHPEAYWAFSRLIDEYPESDEIEDYYYAAFTEALKAKMNDKAKKIGLTYIAFDKLNKYERYIYVQLGDMFIKASNFTEFFDLADEFFQFFPEDEYASRFAYWLGSARIKRQEYELLVVKFSDLLKFYTAAPMTDGLLYWSGMANIFLDGFEPAKNLFDQILTQFPKSQYHEDASFRIGVCDFGLQNFESAYSRLLEFIKNYPGSMLRGEAEVFLGDISASEARVDDAIMHYNKVDQFTQVMQYIAHAYFQQGKLLEANNRFEEMAMIFEKFINKYRTKFDISSAVYQLGRAKEFLGKPEEMLDDYLSAIMRFGNNPYSYGLDQIILSYSNKFHEHLTRINENIEFRDKLMGDLQFRTKFIEDQAFQYQTIKELSNLDNDFKTLIINDGKYRKKILEDVVIIDDIFSKYDERLQKFPKESPEEKLEDAYSQTEAVGEHTLSMRILMTMDLVGKPLKVNYDFNEEDLLIASPATLVWIAEKNKTMRPEFSLLAINRVMSEHAESEYVMDALLAFGSIESQKGNLHEALDIFKQAEKQYPTDPDASKAAILQVDTLIALRMFNEAIVKCQDILKVREWRGEIKAKTQYRIGQAHMEQGNFLKAHGYFQRVYVAYAKFVEWSSRAYLNSGICLENLGKADAAKKTYAQFLKLSSMSSTDVYQEIFERHSRL